MKSKHREMPASFLLNLILNFKNFSGLIIFAWACRCDGIGRRARLKIWCRQLRAGSTPAIGILKQNSPNRRVFYLYKFTRMIIPSAKMEQVEPIHNLIIFSELFVFNRITKRICLMEFFGESQSTFRAHNI